MFNQKQIDNIQFTVVRDLFPTGEFEIMNDTKGDKATNITPL